MSNGMSMASWTTCKGLPLGSVQEDASSDSTLPAQSSDSTLPDSSDSKSDSVQGTVDLETPFPTRNAEAEVGASPRQRMSIDSDASSKGLLGMVVEPRDSLGDTALKENVAPIGQQTSRMIRFQAKCSKIMPGKSVFVIGSTPELGSWKPERAIPCLNKLNSFPIWTSETITIPCSQDTVEFKFIMQGGKEGEKAKWEPGLNRVVKLPTVGMGGVATVTANCEWGSEKTPPPSPIKDILAQAPEMTRRNASRHLVTSSLSGAVDIQMSRTPSMMLISLDDFSKQTEQCQKELKTTVSSVGGGRKTDYADRSKTVLLQGFNWESWQSGKGDWYSTVSAQVDKLAAMGITDIWLPPPSQSVAPQGYLPSQLLNLDGSKYGTQASLEALIRKLHAAGIRGIADIVINHRCGDRQDAQGRWNVFSSGMSKRPSLTGCVDWEGWAVTLGDQYSDGTGKNKPGKNTIHYDAAPNIDHHNKKVQEGISTWLQWLRLHVGFDGWRFDFVKGYEPEFVSLYCKKSDPAFAVGELWGDMKYDDHGSMAENQDKHRQELVNWINSTDKTSTAFDFTTKGILQEAVSRNEYWRLKDKDGKPPGLLGWMPKYAVTFLDNHDTGSTQKHWPFPSGKVRVGYAYIITHPGIPCIFWDHIMDWGDDHRKCVERLLQLRRVSGIPVDASVKILRAEKDTYLAEIGSPATLRVMLGPRVNNEEQVGMDWVLGTEGPDYRVWIRRPEQTVRRRDQALREFAFQPGKLGLAVNDVGTVVTVVPRGQAHCECVQVGMRIVSVNGKAFSVERLDKAIDGSSRYTVKMDVVDADITSTANRAVDGTPAGKKIPATAKPEPAAKTAPAAPAEGGYNAAAAPMAPADEKALDGRWTDIRRKVMKIKDLHVEFHDGTTGTLTNISNGKFHYKLKLGGKDHFAEQMPGKLIWNDGDIWQVDTAQAQAEADAKYKDACMRAEEELKHAEEEAQSKAVEEARKQSEKVLKFDRDDKTVPAKQPKPSQPVAFSPPERVQEERVVSPFVGDVSAFVTRLGAENGNRKSYREKLALSQTLVSEGAINDLQNMACLQAYLTFVASGQITCVEDGRHHRPNHAANSSRAIMQELRQLAKRGDAECFIARRIFPSLPSFSDQFTCAVPMTRIRDIAHRNDIPKDLKTEIKHTLQNKLHRCADPGDLVTCTKIIERIRANKGAYSQPFVEQLEIFYVELKEFFNASGLDDMVSKVAMSTDETRSAAELFLNAKHHQAGDALTQMYALTALRQAILPRVADSQEWQLLDVELEKFAFVSLSSWIANLEQSNDVNGISQALRAALKQLALSGLSQIESTIVVKELDALGSASDKFKSLRMLASAERSIRLCFGLQQRLADAYSNVAALSAVLPIDKRAVDVFLEAELRTSVLFQVSKLAQQISRLSKKQLALPDWIAICPGVALARSVRIAALEDAWRKQGLPEEGYIIFCDRASGEEELPPGCKGVVVQRDLPVLSHLAVRARQLGVIFACTAEADLFKQQARFPDGTPLRLTVTSGGDVTSEQVDANVLTVSKATQKPDAASKAVAPELGRLNLKEMSVLSAAEADRLTPDSVGAKASSAGRLDVLSRQLGGGQDGDFKTPLSCSIPFGIMRGAVRGAAFDSALSALEKSLAAQGASDIDAKTEAVRTAIAALKISPEVLKAVQAAFPGDTKEVAVRSSANSEDLENVSGAGLHDSLLGVNLKSGEDLEAAILQVWGSLFTVRAVQSRHHAGMPLYKDIAMGVLIQQMASLSTNAGQTYSFIMFTEHVAANDPGKVYVELCAGLGETLASANIPGTPYRVSVAKQGSKDVNLISLASFSQALYSMPSGVEYATVDYSSIRLSTDNSFLEKLARRLAAVAVRVEEFYGCGMDIEGVAIEKDGNVDVFLVQARPIVKAEEDALGKAVEEARKQAENELKHAEEEALLKAVDEARMRAEEERMKATEAASPPALARSTFEPVNVDGTELTMAKVCAMDLCDLQRLSKTLLPLTSAVQKAIEAKQGI